MISQFLGSSAIHGKIMLKSNIEIEKIERIIVRLISFAKRSTCIIRACNYFISCLGIMCSHNINQPFGSPYNFYK